jgi:hypothetical protein
MKVNKIAVSLVMLLAASVTPVAFAQGTGGPNASSSTGAANADTMSPGATGNVVTKGAGDTSASGASASTGSKSVKKKSAKANKRTNAGSSDVKPAQ